MLLHRIAPLLLLSMSLIACRSPEMAEVDPRSQQNHGTDPGAGTEMFTDPTQFASPTGGGDGGDGGGYTLAPTLPEGPGGYDGGGIDRLPTPDPTTIPSAFAPGPVNPDDDGTGMVVSDQPYETVYFSYDQSSIGDSERVKLDRVADYLLQNATYNLHIEGHCDERGSEEYNRSLGERRAISARDYLAARGIDTARLTTQSYGEEKPVVAGASEDAFSRNRRAELKLVTPRAAIR